MNLREYLTENHFDSNIPDYVYDYITTLTASPRKATTPDYRQEDLGKKWAIDMYKLDSKTEGNALIVTAVHLCRELFKEDQTDLFIDMMYRIQMNYADLPFRNAAHGAVVLHNFALIYTSIEINRYTQRNGVSDDMFQLCLYIAAAGHAIGSCGKLNAEMHAECHPYSLVFNDHHSNESYSAFTLVSIVNKSGFFSYYGGSRIPRTVRKLLTEGVLATAVSFNRKQIADTHISRVEEEIREIAYHNHAKDVALCALKMADIAMATSTWTLYQEDIARLYRENNAMDHHNDESAHEFGKRMSDHLQNQFAFNKYVVMEFAKNLSKFDAGTLFIKTIIPNLEKNMIGLKQYTDLKMFDEESHDDVMSK